MATPTYDLLASTTLATAASSVTFSSIDQNYGDLILVVEASVGSSARALSAQFNNDTGSNYYRVQMEGDGSSAYSDSSTSTQLNVGRVAGTGNKALSVIQIMDYSATDKHKSILSRANDVNVTTFALAGRWASTSAINEIDLLSNNTFEAGSTFNLYGVAK